MYIDRCCRAVNVLDFKTGTHENNLSPSEKQALLHLTKQDDIIIKPADKGGAVVVWPRPLYDAEAHRQLSDGRFYERLDHDPVKEYQQVIKSAVEQMIQANELPGSAKNLILQTPRTSHFYLLPKIHKENNPGRPIVSACNCPTENIASYLDMVMSPLVCNLKTYVKDTNHALQIFRTFQFTDNGDTSQRFLYTMDVKSLYTVILHNSGLEALKYFLNKRPVLNPPTETLTRLVELVLTLNAFSFNNEFYHQVGGVAMGSKMGPNYTCLFVGYVEEQIGQQYTGTLPRLHKRYIDDVVGIACCSRFELEDYISFVSNFHPALQFTHLDINWRISGDRIRTSIHYKASDTHSYLHYDSSHSRHCKESLPYSQLLRLRRICSDQADFLDKAQEMASFFERRGYSTQTLKHDLEKIKHLSQSDALSNSNPTEEKMNRIPLILTYHPLNTRVQQILLDNFKVITDDPATSLIFPQPPMVAFQHDDNLQTSLVHTAEKQAATRARTYPCQHPRCRTCGHISNETDLLGPKIA